MHFIGDHFTTPERIFLGLRIDPMHRQDEAGLQRKTWFDYRELDPVQRTSLFAHFYKVQTEHFYRTCIDIRTVEEARAFTPEDIFMSRDLTSMWLARRAADEVGLPYPTVMEFAQKRALDRHFHRFPRPNQLYGEEFEQDLASHWQKLLAEGLRYSQEERMKLDPESGRSMIKSQAVLEHAEFVIKQIKSRPRPHYRLLARMLKERVLGASLEAVQTAFTEEEIDQADDYLAFFG